MELNDMKIFKEKSDTLLKKEYIKVLKDKDFENYVRSIHLSHDVLMKYTSNLEVAFKEKQNCSNCNGLEYCKNNVYGFCLREVVNKDNISFEYKSCKYKDK